MRPDAQQPSTGTPPVGAYARRWDEMRACAILASRALRGAVFMREIVRQLSSGVTQHGALICNVLPWPTARQGKALSLPLGRRPSTDTDTGRAARTRAVAPTSSRLISSHCITTYV